MTRRCVDGPHRIRRAAKNAHGSRCTSGNGIAGAGQPLPTWKCFRCLSGPGSPAGFGANSGRSPAMSPIIIADCSHRSAPCEEPAAMLVIGNYNGLNLPNTEPVTPDRATDICREEVESVAKLTGHCRLLRAARNGKSSLVLQSASRSSIAMSSRMTPPTSCRSWLALIPRFFLLKTDRYRRRSCRFTLTDVRA